MAAVSKSDAASAVPASESRRSSPTLPRALLQNKSGNFVAAGEKSGEAALAAAELGPDLRGWIDDPQGAEAYPIVSFTWMLFYKQQDDKKAEVLRKMVEYGITEGHKILDSMGYIPLPANVWRRSRRPWRRANSRGRA